MSYLLFAKQPTEDKWRFAGEFQTQFKAQADMNMLIHHGQVAYYRKKKACDIVTREGVKNGNK